MAEIDKTLPNVKQTVNIPGPEEIEIAEQEKLAQQQEAGQPVETQENDNNMIIKLFTINGTLVFADKITGSKTKIKTKKLRTGNYILKITNDKGKPIHTEKIVIL